MFRLPASVASSRAKRHTSSGGLAWTGEFDLVYPGGRVATAIETFEADIAIEDGRIMSISQRREPEAREIDATGQLVLPGGVDSHCHIEQMSAPAS